MRAARIRQAGLGMVMVGALAVSVRGQVQAVAPLLGAMGVVLALTNDLAALLALNEIISTRRVEVRRWAWAVLVLAGGTAAGLNTWHAVVGGRLPAVWAVVVGIGPVLLAMLLSHLVALVLDDPAAPTGPATSSGDDSRAATPTQLTPQTTAAATSGEPHNAAGEASRAGQVTPPQTGPGVHPGLAVVRSAPVLPVLPAEAPADRSAADDAGEGLTDERVARIVGQLRAGGSLTGAAVAEQEGCSERTGRRLLQQAQQHIGTQDEHTQPDPEHGSAPDAARGTG